MAELETIGSLSKRVGRILAEQFPGAKVTIERAKPAEKIGGIIVWKGFDGLDQVDRQSRLWSALRSQLSSDEQRKITAILTMAPAER